MRPPFRYIRVTMDMWSPIKYRETIAKVKTIKEQGPYSWASVVYWDGFEDVLMLKPDKINHGRYDTEYHEQDFLAQVLEQ